VFDVVERPTFAEFSWIERQSGVPSEAMTSSEKGASIALLTLRRHGVMLTWNDIVQMSPVDFDYIDEAPDPTPLPEAEGNS
jgi:hypothetical protein